MRGKVLALFVCMLMLIGTLLPFTAAVNQPLKISNPAVEQTPLKWTIRPGFIWGYFDSVVSTGDRYVITSGGKNHLIRMPVSFIAPFRSHVLGTDQQIQLIKPVIGIVLKHHIIGFSRIYLPKATISMHITSQNNETNKVTWVVDNITGDPIWEHNIIVTVYNDSGQRYRGEWRYGFLGAENLSVGDILFVQTSDNEWFHVIITEDVTGYTIYDNYLKF